MNAATDNKSGGTRYNPTEVEEKWYKYWLENGFFHSTPDSREPYAIVIPPPNVTGVLHMGHMLNNTIQDVLVRRARMQGKNACWVPGTDHASIATEAKVVNKLAQEGIKKSDLTREEFLEHAWEWTHRHGGIILEQLKRLGVSCDWDRTAFTMDEKRSMSVMKVFCDLYEKGLIYRDKKMVNWDPQARTTISDEEVNYKEQNGKLYYLRYKIVGENNYAIVATTRPETIFGDTAMCINPNNPKTAHLKGKHVTVPLIGSEIPVIEDEYVDIDFGTGCLKVTPAHDINDYMLGEKYNLPSIDIFNDDGTLNENGAMYAGTDRFDCRRKIEKDLDAAGLLEKVEAYTNKVGFSERTNVPVEPKLSTQWFLKMKEIATPAIENVENDTIKFFPEKFKNTYRHWMENIRDWNISRQLWWGHRIPVWYILTNEITNNNNNMQSIENFNFKGQKAIVRVDFNVPLDEKFNITDDTRIRAAMPTLKKITADGGSIIICSHLGRPKNVEAKYSLRHILPRVQELLGVPVDFADDCLGQQAAEKSAALQPGQALLLENLRFYAAEEGKPRGLAEDATEDEKAAAKKAIKAEQKEMAKRLASYATVYVNDAFGTAHRAHASTAIIADSFDPGHKLFGYLMNAEVNAVEKILNQIQRPFTAIMGGSKVSSKIEIIENLLTKVDNLIIAGGMTYTFTKAQGGKIGKSIVEDDKLELALELIKKAKANNVNLVLAVDAKIADDFSNDAKTQFVPSGKIPDGWEGLDIGPETEKIFAGIIEKSKTILWNGPTGVFEFENFTHGSRAVAEAIVKATEKGAYSLIGGGDSVACINKFGLADRVSYVSTGGGALLEAIEGKELPGIKAIKG